MIEAPGHPGIEPRWTSSAKEGVGTALSHTSRVWFTLSHGILNEIYFMRVDQACTRDFGFLVTGPDGYFSEEKRATERDVSTIERGVPVYRLHNRARDGRYEILKEIICDSDRDVVLQRLTFRKAADDPLRLYGLLAPHLVNGGQDNTGWLGAYKTQPMLFAEGDGTSLALGASVPFRARSVGFVGVSDGWQQLVRDGEIRDTYEIARNGNVALTAELPVGGAETTCIVALGFGRTWSEAALRVRGSLQEEFDTLRTRYVKGWRKWQAGLRDLEGPEPGEDGAYRMSTMVLRCHESPTFPGGLIASLSIPWGSEKGDNDLGGYHLVWPRDLVQTAGGFLAAGAWREARRVLRYLRATQEAEGHWAQNMWLDGTPYWSGVQLDEVGLPILLTDMLFRAGALAPRGVERFWPMVRGAADFLVRTGPITGQDRWEENGGYTPYTLAVTITALLAAAELGERCGDGERAARYRETADRWYGSLDEWLYARDTDLARSLGIDGYYVRVAPPAAPGERPTAGTVDIRNRADGERRPAASIVSPDALALVRFGLRAPDDPRILGTVAAIDHLLKVEFEAGPCWHRYNEDGYGEHDDGRAFDGTGIGRAWPLLSGERAHYELAAGRPEVARALARTMERLSSAGGLMPEQVWDHDDIPERELFRGKPSGSAMPLVWAHSEHIKLCRSLADGVVFDTPPAVAARYA
ncbi:MAG: glucan 1,4-alpha-glucosidase, partial [Methylobacteriaceae bacterium]|nr:glucan 1,4-alpha-glucosidase [Methylobacteriaceae bacterium]